VQTVFNHFESKEALFFDGRTPWVEGVVAAVGRRAPGSDPVAALRAYIEADLIELLDQESRPENRGYLEALRRSPSLQARERTLLEQVGHRVAAELTAAIGAGDWPAAPATDRATARLLSRLIADLLLAAGRVLVLENRRVLMEPGAEELPPRPVTAVTATTLAAIEHSVADLARQLLAAGPPERPS
jgi:AcrR family transcriptional regulator